MGLGRVAPVAASIKKQRRAWIRAEVEDLSKNDFVIARIVDRYDFNLEPSECPFEQRRTSTRERPANAIELVSARLRKGASHRFLMFAQN